MDFDDGKGVMDEGKRNARNLSEKKRRDQFNTLLTELGNILNVMPEAAGQVAALQVCSLSTKLFYCEKIQSTLGFATMGKAANLGLATRNDMTDLF